MKSPTTTLGETAFLNLYQDRGQMKAAIAAARVGSCLLTMAQTAEKIGHWPTRAEYAAEWKVSPRQLSRDWQLVHQALGVTATDPQLAEWIMAQRGFNRADNVKQLEALPAPHFATLAA